MIMKGFGPTQRIRLKLTKDKHSLSHYVVFGNSKSAQDVQAQLDDHSQHFCFKNKD